jgi:hypothetical protein
MYCPSRWVTAEYIMNRPGMINNFSRNNLSESATLQATIIDSKKLRNVLIAEFCFVFSFVILISSGLLMSAKLYDGKTVSFDKSQILNLNVMLNKQRNAIAA